MTDDEREFRRHFYIMMTRIMNSQCALMLGVSALVTSNEIRDQLVKHAQEIQKQTDSLLAGLDMNNGETRQ